MFLFWVFHFFLDRSSSSVLWRPCVLLLLGVHRSAVYNITVMFLLNIVPRNTPVIIFCLEYISNFDWKKKLHYKHLNEKMLSTATCFSGLQIYVNFSNALYFMYCHWLESPMSLVSGVVLIVAFTLIGRPHKLHLHVGIHCQLTLISTYSTLALTLSLPGVISM